MPVGSHPAARSFVQVESERQATSIAVIVTRKCGRVMIMRTKKNAMLNVERTQIRSRTTSRARVVVGCGVKKVEERRSKSVIDPPGFASWHLTSVRDNNYHRSRA